MDEDVVDEELDFDEYEDEDDEYDYENYHYERIQDVPVNIRKYWHQRHTIFSKYDEGIQLTDEAWFGVTPEPVANMIAKHVAQAAPRNSTTLIDVFSGVGGNSIAFALSERWDEIFSIEKDATVLQCARENAEIYGVNERIQWIDGDYMSVLDACFNSNRQTQILFASPPWGGPNYKSDTVFDLETMEPYNLTTLYTHFSAVTDNFVLYLPRTSDLEQIAKFVPAEKKTRVIHYCIRGASKALCAYFGDFHFPELQVFDKDSPIKT